MSRVAWVEGVCACARVCYINSHACHVLLLLLVGVCAGTASGRRTCPALSPTTVARGGWSRTRRTGSPAPAPPSRAPSASWLSSQAPTSVRPAGRGHRSEAGAWREIGFEVASLLRLGTTPMPVSMSLVSTPELHIFTLLRYQMFWSPTKILGWGPKQLYTKHKQVFVNFTGDSNFFLQI